MVRRDIIAYGIAGVIVCQVHAAVAEETFVENFVGNVKRAISLNAAVTKYMDVVPPAFPVSAKDFGSVSKGADVAFFGLNVYWRGNDERISLRRAVAEQAVVFAAGKGAQALGTATLVTAACAALTGGACLAAIATVAVGSYVVGQIPDQLFRAKRDFEIARQTEIETERRRLEAYSKTPAFRDRQVAAQQQAASRQTAQQAQPGQPVTAGQPRVAAAPSGPPPPASAPASLRAAEGTGLPAAIATPVPSSASRQSDDWLRAVMNNPKESRAARAIAAIALGKDPWIILGKPQPPRPATPAAVPRSDDWLRAVMNNPNERPQARAIAAIALGKDPAAFTDKTSGTVAGGRSASAPSRQSDDWLRAIMNNPSETPQARAIAAIALGKKPSAYATSSPSSGSQPAASAAPAAKLAPSQSAVASNGRADGRIASVGAFPAPSSAPRQPTPTRPARAPAPVKPPLSANIARLTPPAPPPAPRAPPYYAAPHAAVTGFARPGGISLSRAAAERMVLNFELEGSYLTTDEIVFAGRPNEGGFDAALFLTAVRLACQPDDPYFSLDPDNGRAWSDEGRHAAEALWDRISGEFGLGAANRPASWRKIRNGLAIRAVSARRDYAHLWTSLATAYPNFNTRLVFHPLWLGETRFGEILYKADVLLKELASGAPALRSAAHLRAKSIGHYVSADERGAARRLLTLVESGRQPAEVQWRGHRLWFDLVPKMDMAEDAHGAASRAAMMIRPHGGPAGALYGLLRSRGHFAMPPASAPQQATLGAHSNALDVSKVYPKMFVRRHDAATGRDIPGHDQDLDGLSADVNERSDRYASVYQELRDLVRVFRAYLVAVKMAESQPRICATANSLPLLDSEKVPIALPRYHQSELFVTIATYAYSNARQRRWLASIKRSVNGGIALRGREFLLQEAEISRPTPITVELAQELADGVRKPAWQASSGRQLVAFRLDPDEGGADPHPGATAALSATPANIPAEEPATSVALTGFDLHAQSRVSGRRLNSALLRTDSGAAAAQSECARICLAERHCVAFELDQSQSQCNIYGEVFRTFREPQWMYGLRNNTASSR